MPEESAVYHWLSCSAKVDNLVAPRCLARSEGVFDDRDTMRKRAQVAGWTSPSKAADFCPAHSVASMAPVMKVRAARAAAASSAAEPASDQQ